MTVSYTSLGFIALLVVLNQGAWDVAAECPNMDRLDVAKDDQFVCAYTWGGDRGGDPMQSCNSGKCKQGTGCIQMPDIIYDNANYTARLVYAASVAVMPGCTLFVFSEAEYEGTVRRHYDLETEFEASAGCNCGGRVHSYKCRCDQEMIDCQPRDKFTLILSCDNTKGSQPVQCYYSETQGTSYGNQEMMSKSVSEAVSSAIEARLGRLYSSQIGYSLTTGRDWSDSTSSTFAEPKTYSLSAVANAGELLQIEQVVGQCGDSITYTNFFRITNIGGGGGAVNVSHYSKEQGAGFYEPLAMNESNAPIFVDMNKDNKQLFEEKDEPDVPFREDTDEGNAPFLVEKDETDAPVFEVSDEARPPFFAETDEADILILGDVE